ncbi:hypothetical protein [Thiocystis violascens]|uniref:Uncharacterized protein n=1 Tax=Thiocystis violascens (strain ATCC 17096 / DSM 198 / 6111) TaxID=765911 RepID=I3YEG5_THIV6|nr:hypothetical protein [Thiocystis violascens]AFL75383.1 hypothetical protein Thivi_3516 [Thiocystis violascens DSM 198]
MLASDTAWKLAIDLGQFVLTGAIGVYVYFANQAQARREALERLASRLDQRLDVHDTRLIAAESGVSHASSRESCALHTGQLNALRQLIDERPGHEDLKRVHARVDKLAELVARIDGRLEGIDRNLNGIDRNLQLIIEQLLDASGGRP